MYQSRQCYDHSQWLGRIQEPDFKLMEAKFESQAHLLDFKNQLRTQGKPFEKGQRVWLCKLEDTLKDHNKSLPLWEGPFQVKGQLSETTLDIEVKASRYQEVHWGPLEDEVRCPKGSYKPLYWKMKYHSNRKMATSSFELQNVPDYMKDARTKWYFLYGWKAHWPEEDDGSQH